MPLYDAHNHLQDGRFQGQFGPIMEIARGLPIRKMVVNGSCEADWPQVLSLAKDFPEVLPSFGYHPWYIQERSAKWRDVLSEYLDAFPSAIGEIGLDRWIKNYDFPAQEEVFVWQLRLAAARDLPVSIHCLQAWGKLLETLEREPRPACGFVLHSYGGPQEMIPALAKLGAYFSLPGYFAHERKQKQRETFRQVPLDRLLIETDAPDQILPPQKIRFPLLDESNKPINHPGNLVSVYEFAEELLGVPVAELTSRIEQNFLRVFGSLVR